MKRYHTITGALLCVVALSAIAQVLYAQTAIESPTATLHFSFIQVEGGANYSFFHSGSGFRTLLAGESSGGANNNASGAGIHAGIALGYRIKDIVTLAIATSYDQMHASASEAMQDTRETMLGGPEVEGVRREFGFDLAYLTVAVRAEFKAGDFRFWFAPMVGVPIGRGYSAANTILDQTSACYYFQGSFDQSKHEQNLDSSLVNIGGRFALELGLGYTIKLSETLTLIPQISGEIPFTSILKRPELLHLVASPEQNTQPDELVLNADSKTYLLRASLGLRFIL